MELIPYEYLSNFAAIFLIFLAGVTSFITAAFGAGGGLLLLVVMASILPMTVVIPVHGLVQLGSNGNRMLFTFRHIDRRMFFYFSFGGIFGALASTLVVTDISLELMKVIVAFFVLYLLWGVTPKLRESSKLWQITAGALTTFASMFVGASGPLVGSCIYVNGYNKLRFTATFSSCMTFQHTLKAFVYSSIGFAFWQWLPLVITMVISGAIGTWFGLRVLKTINGENFKLIFRIILSLLTLQLGWQGVISFLNK